MRAAMGTRCESLETGVGTHLALPRWPCQPALQLLASTASPGGSLRFRARDMLRCVAVLLPTNHHRLTLMLLLLLLLPPPAYGDSSSF